MKNDLNKKFGKLTPIALEKDKNGYNTRYLCKCDCGNTHSVSKTHLRSGRITHCGCVRRLGSKHSQWTGIGEISGDFWYDHVKRSADGSKGRKVKELSITIEDAWNLFLKQNRKCALSGLDLTFPKKSKDKNYTASLDRIDSSEGYMLENVQWVHKHINKMKNNFDNQYFINVCREVCIFQAKKDTIKSSIPLHEQGRDILTEIETDDWLKL
jgi:hypothetical protein